MKKDKTRNPLMLAYIIFLCICGIYHVISGAFNLEFPMWQRVVVATTIASYFFSLCSVSKLTAKTSKKVLEYTEEQNSLYRELYKKTAPKKNEASPDAQNSTTYSDFLNNQIAENIKTSSKTRKEIINAEKKSFGLDVAGFLVFFCIMAFDWAYLQFAKSQEWSTLLAFIIVLCVEYLETTKLTSFEAIYHLHTKRLKEMLKMLEDNE